MKATNFLGTILFGVAAGVAIGVLLAPAKGSKTIKKVKDYEHDLEDRLKSQIKNGTEKIDDLADLLESRIDQFKRTVDKASERLQNKLA